MKLCRLAILLSAAMALSNATQAQDFRSKASARLIGAGELAGEAYHGAIVIDLAPGAITYWRNPGEAGVPPTFDFSGSDNLARADVAMPAPTRINEAGGDVFGYATQVAFPITIVPSSREKPARLALKLDYAACDKICVPMHADLTLDLAPGGKAGDAAAAIAAAEAAIPKRVAADQAAAMTRVAGQDKPTWRVAPKSPDALDLFAEAPDGYFIETARAPDGAFRLVLAERPQGAGLPKAPVRLTLARKSGAVEFEARLDGAGPAP